MRVHVPDAFSDRPAEYVATHYAAGIVESAMAFSRITYERSKLSLREFEVARMRTAQINGCMLCLNWRSYRDVDAYVRALGGGRKPWRATAQCQMRIFTTRSGMRRPIRSPHASRSQWNMRRAWARRRS